MRKFFILLGLFFISTVSNAEVCNKSISNKDYEQILQISIKMNNLNAVDKILKSNCVKIKNLNDEEVLSINSIEMINRLNSFNILNLRNKEGLRLIDFKFNYNIKEQEKYINKKTGISWDFKSVNNLAKKTKYQFITKKDLKLFDFENIKYEKYNDYLKYLVTIQYPVKTKLLNNEEFINLMHASVYNGNYELFDFFKNYLGKDFDVNIRNTDGQPLIVSAINHSCLLSDTDIENEKKIIKDIVNHNDFFINFSFIGSNKSVKFGSKNMISFKELLKLQKEFGEPKTFDYSLDLLGEKNRALYSNVVLGKNILPKDVMKKGVCETPRKLNL